MKDAYLRRGPTGDRDLVLARDVGFAEMNEWRPTVAHVRDALLESRVGGMNEMGFPEADLRAPTPIEVTTIAQLTHTAVSQGCLIDFGFIPNALIIDGGIRGGPLYQNDALPLPFRRPWVLFHTWDAGSPSGQPSASVYLVNSIQPTRPGGDLEICELQPFDANGVKTLIIGDRVWLQSQPNADHETGYTAAAVPGVWRYLPGAEITNMGKSPENAAAGNLLDPLMTCLLMFHARGGVQIRTVQASAKLNRAREKARKPPIPPHMEVDGRAYVTLLTEQKARRLRGEPRGGTHASPTPHIRTAHIRDYPSGARSFIADTLVNVDEAARSAFKATRSHYALKR